MPKIDVYNIEGKKVSTIELNDNVFGIKPNEKILLNGQVIWQIYQVKEKWLQINCEKVLDVLHLACKTYR